MVDFVLNAKARSDIGKGASRRLRRLSNEIPAIVYGGKNAPQKISLTHKDMAQALENEAFYSHILTLNIDDKSEDVILKDVQRHPAKCSPKPFAESAMKNPSVPCLIERRLI